MLAQRQGGLLKVAQLAGNLGIDAKTAQRYIDLLCALLSHTESVCWNAKPDPILLD